MDWSIICMLHVVLASSDLFSCCSSAQGDQPCTDTSDNSNNVMRETSRYTKSDNLDYCQPSNPEKHGIQAIEEYSTQHSAMTTSLALVPYDEAAVLPHQKTSREFTLAGETFTIKQDWQKLGVAAVVWDSAVVMAEYLIKNKSIIEGKNVLELGAGTGLTGMVAASLGARVTVTERAEALDHLRSTIQENTAGKAWDITIKVLDWTKTLDDEPGLVSPDVILGADIIYIEETFQDLLRTILNLAKTKETDILLSCKIRYDRDLYFLTLLREHFDVKEVLYDKERDIKMFSVKRHS